MTESNLRIVNYLDVTLKLNGGSLRPCDKPYDIIQYVNKESNLITHRSASIEKRLSDNPSGENSIYCEDTLKQAT